MLSRISLCMLGIAAVRATAQSATPQAGSAMTAEQDHQIMMTQLGIRRLRPGPSGNENAPNHANYDESLANPYPDLPQVLRLDDGARVTTPATWWNRRRPQIIEAFEREVYGRVPKVVPKVSWRATLMDHQMVDSMPVIAKQLIGHVDNSADPDIEVDIKMVVVVPANARARVPLLMMFGRAMMPVPADPPQNQFERMMVAARKPNIAELLADGWGYAFIDPSSIQADNGAGLTKGIIGLVNKGQPRKPDDWGALRAWAWGAARGLDYLETDSAVDAKHVGIEGVSRYGKAALVTLAFEPRFAMGLIGSSGKGGATLHRRNFGEAVESLAGSGEYHWMAGNYLKYAADDASFGRKTAADLPVDSHELIALCAPRLTFISYGVPEKGDAKWLDHEGSFMAAVAAQPVFRLLGAKGMGAPDDYHAAKMPAMNDGLLGGALAWRQHDGGHTDAPNVKYFIQWADSFIKHAPK